MNPLISIIIPAYNRGYILPRAINSVVRQTYVNWELIIVDDGSTDDTKTIVEQYSDPRIKYFFQENAGQSAARNTGMRNATGEWLAYLDSDDELLPLYMETMLRWIDNNPNTLYLLSKYSRQIEIYKDSEIFESYEDSVNVADTLTVRDIFLRKYYLSSVGFMHHRTIVSEGIQWDEALPRMPDWDFFMTIAERFPEQFLYVQEELAVYHRRMGTDGLSSNTSYKMMADAFEYIYQKHKNNKLLIGQTWYPERVEKYIRLFKESPDGTLENRHWKDGVVQYKKRVGEQ
jgi:glycosyltransferase involved in cell wall biosynthesis